MVLGQNKADGYFGFRNSVKASGLTVLSSRDGRNLYARIIPAAMKNTAQNCLRAKNGWLVHWEAWEMRHALLWICCLFSLAAHHKAPKTFTQSIVSYTALNRKYWSENYKLQFISQTAVGNGPSNSKMSSLLPQNWWKIWEVTMKPWTSIKLH